MKTYWFLAPTPALVQSHRSVLKSLLRQEIGEYPYTAVVPRITLVTGRQNTTSTSVVGKAVRQTIIDVVYGSSYPATTIATLDRGRRTSCPRLRWSSTWYLFGIIRNVKADDEEESAILSGISNLNWSMNVGNLWIVCLTILAFFQRGR